MKKSILISSLIITGIVATGFIHSQQEKGKQKKAEVSVGLSVGQKAPEIALRNPDSVVVKLSSLKGKVVLIDFWASWCGPCRRENPNVVKAYETYSKRKFKNAKGFDIYSVSLDSDKNRWLQAIETDRLTWKTHVSDLKQWRSEAVPLYQVTGIPTNWLIDSKGIIIAQNLRGYALEQELEKLVVPEKPTQ